VYLLENWLFLRDHIPAETLIIILVMRVSASNGSQRDSNFPPAHYVGIIGRPYEFPRDGPISLSPLEPSYGRMKESFPSWHAMPWTQ
jgi:hypothetical protein